jgi:DNA-binding transcriptional regulator WhiA
MARRWTEQEEIFYRSQLIELYVNQNKTIDEVGLVLGIKWQTVYDRLIRLDIPTHPELKTNYLHKRTDIIIPNYSDDLAEFFGMMLGDGHLSHFQVSVCLGTKEMAYAEYVAEFIGKLFGCNGKIAVNSHGHRTVYLGSVKATQWLQNEGLVFNKVKSQVDAPRWVFEKESYMKHCLRGFFDTDGSIYELKFGLQISFTNYSIPLLVSLQQMLIALEYNVSAISSHRLYLTKISDVERFFTEIDPQNPKHNERFERFITRYRNNRTGSLVRREN